MVTSSSSLSKRSGSTTSLRTLPTSFTSCWVFFLFLLGPGSSTSESEEEGEEEEEDEEEYL